MRALLRTAFIVLFIPNLILAQAYDDFIGAGHADGVVVSSSNEHQPFGWDISARAQSTIDGAGLDGRFMETARFLSQATLGADEEMIREVASQDFATWIDEQKDVPYASQLDLMNEIIDEALAIYVAGGGNPEDYFSPGFNHFIYSWWQTNMTNEDLLRQRVAYALSQIAVVSFASNLDEHVEGMADYYDMLIENSMGNYRDILNDITYHGCMAVYLSHYNNPLTIDSLNVHPDENYAREVMQLFSIGLYELNQDGTHVLDVDGNSIPTYGINEIKEFAKVFTGLGASAVMENPFIEEPYFGMGRYFADFTQPLAMYDEWHESGPKTLLSGYVIDGGQSGDQDITEALDHLFNHPNVGPFVSRRLIQNMVKSNPTPSYIQRVSTVFNDNGEGVRGDMHAVVKAILLDEEARTCEWIQHPEQGKLREPMLRYTHTARSSEKLTDEAKYWNVGYDFYESTDQMPLGANSVFNFFLPDFQPNGPLADAELVGPEFQIHNSRTSLEYLNEVNDWTLWWALMYSWDDVSPVFINTNELEEMSKDPEVLINHFDRLYTNGLMTQELRENLLTMMSAYTGAEVGPSYLEYRARIGLFLVLISPDYAIQK